MKNTTSHLDDLIIKHKLKHKLVDSSGRIDNYGEGPVITIEGMAKPASRFIDSVLVARKPLKLYKTPSETSEVLMDFPKSANVGRIYSYVVRDGQVWWQINWFSGKHAGWVKNIPGLFDTAIAEQTSSGLAHDTTMAEMKKMNENPLDKLGDGLSNVVSGVGDGLSGVGDLLGNLKYIIIAVVIGAIVLAFLRVQSSAN